jgi:hypothetical protein
VLGQAEESVRTREPRPAPQQPCRTVAPRTTRPCCGRLPRHGSMHHRSPLRQRSTLCPRTPPPGSPLAPLNLCLPTPVRRRRTRRCADPLPLHRKALILKEIGKTPSGSKGGMTAAAAADLAKRLAALFSADELQPALEAYAAAAWDALGPTYLQASLVSWTFETRKGGCVVRVSSICVSMGRSGARGRSCGCRGSWAPAASASCAARPAFGLKENPGRLACRATCRPTRPKS